MYRIGIDLGGTKTEGVVMDGRSQILARRRVPTPAGDYAATLAMLVEMVASADFYFAENLQYEPEATQKFLQPEAAAHLKEIAARIPAWKNFTKEGIEEFLKSYAHEKEIKLQVIAQPLRVALTGKMVSPGIDEVMVTLGKDIVIKRIQAAADWIVANN